MKRAKLSIVAAYGLSGLAASVCVAQPVGLWGLGSLAGVPVDSAALGVSRDGTYVVGSAVDGAGKARAVMWGPNGQIVLLDTALTPAPAVDFTIGESVSNGGAYAACNVWSNDFCSYATRWESDGRAFVLAENPCNTFARDVSDTGTVVGDTYLARSMAMRWLASGVTEQLRPAAGYVESSAAAVSGDGNFVVGSCSGPLGVAACLWTADATCVLIPNLPNTARAKVARCFAIAADGSYAVGESVSTANGNELEPFRYHLASNWTEGLGIPPGGRSVAAIGVNSGGQRIVGYYFTDANPATRQAVLWREGRGWTLLSDYLTTEVGVSLHGFQLLAVQGISSDGTVLVGEGVNVGGFREAWMARIPPMPARCIADFNGSGGVDGDDVAAFFISWVASDFETDVNANGGVDGGDVETFFIAWAAGC